MLYDIKSIKKKRFSSITFIYAVYRQCMTCKSECMFAFLVCNRLASHIFHGHGLRMWEKMPIFASRNGS